MRVLPEGLQNMLAGDATTLCSAWIIIRVDGRVIGLTDHDRSLVVDGTKCDPMDGAERSEVEANIGTNSDTATLTGILSSDMITDADLAAGRYDDAQITQYAVDWANPDACAALRTFRMGEITLGEGVYTAELRGASGLLSRPHRRIFSQMCRATFCDASCGLLQAQFTHQATVSELMSGQTVAVTKPADMSAQQFQNGLLREKDGAGVATISSARETAQGTLLLSLTQPLENIKTGLEVELVQGCDKSFATCRDRFDNALNFRGFPHMPGNHQILNYIDEETVFDGEPIVP